MLKKLLNKKMKVLKNQQGLTLIELLVVIVILGIIAAIAIPAVMNQRTTANQNANAQTVSVLLDAAKRYQAITGNWPATGTAGTSNMSELDPEYIDEIPTTCADGSAGTFTFIAPTTADPVASVVTSCPTP